jgi:hypothetical protein
VIKSGRVSSFGVVDVFSLPKVGQNSGRHFPARVMSSPLIITKDGAARNFLYLRRSGSAPSPFLRKGVRRGVEGDAHLIKRRL